jgi:hypothetical protein
MGAGEDGAQPLDFIIWHKYTFSRPISWMPLLARGLPGKCLREMDFATGRGSVLILVSATGITGGERGAHSRLPEPL